MKNFSIVAFIAAFVIALFLSYQKINSSPPVQKLGQSMEESEKKKQMEIDMLVDPTTGKLPADFRSRELQYLRHFSSSAKTTGADWVQRGPWNVGGRTRALSMDVTDPDILVAASVSGGIFRSTDQGASWTRTFGMLDHQGIVSIAQDPRVGHENMWYALGGEASGASQSGAGAYYFGDGVFVSSDSAKSWTPLASTDNGNYNSYTNFFQTGWRIAVSPRMDKDVIYVCSIYGIQRSDDGGQTWSFARGDFSNPFNYYTDIDISTSGVSYLALSAEDIATKGIFRSVDDSTYVDITPDSIIDNYGRIVLDVNPNNENEVYFLVHMDDSTGNPGAVPTTNYKGAVEYVALLKYTYLSGDGSGAGGMWTNLSSNLPTTGGGPFDKINFQGGYDMCVKVQPGTGNVFIGGTNLYFSTSGFSTSNNTAMIGGYKPLTFLPHFEIYPVHHPDQHDVVFSPLDTALVISASDGGVRSTEDIYSSTVAWNNLNGGYFTSQYYTVTIDRYADDDKALLGGFQDNGNFYTPNDDITHQWEMPFNGDGAYNFIARNKEFVVMSIQLGKMIKATLDQNGALLNFTRIDPAYVTDSNDYMFINPFVVDPNDNNVLYLPAGRKLYRQDSLSYLSLDGNYDAITSGWTLILDSLIPAGEYISAIDVSEKNDANIVYLGTSRGHLIKIQNANSSQITVEDVTEVKFPNNAFINCVEIDDYNSDNVAVVFSAYNIPSIFYSENGAADFEKAGGNLELTTFGIPPSVRWLSIVNAPYGYKKYLVGTSIGLFSTDTLKASPYTVLQSQWEREGENEIGASIIKHITYRYSDGYVVAGTHGSGAYAAHFGVPQSIVEVSDLKLKAYPNPATDQINIQIPEGEKVQQVQLLNVLGQKIYRTPHFEFLNQILNLDISDIQKGMYLAHIITDKHSYVVSLNKN